MTAPVAMHRPPSRPCVLRSAAAFGCEVNARGLSGSHEVTIAYHRAASPRLAARWMRAEAQRLARLLAPDPSAPHLRSVSLVPADPVGPRPAGELLAWADDDERYEHALHVLASGDVFTLDVTDYDAVYSVRAYPLRASRPSQPPAPVGRRAYAPAGAGRHRMPRGWRSPL